MLLQELASQLLVLKSDFEALSCQDSSNGCFSAGQGHHAEVLSLNCKAKTCGVCITETTEQTGPREHNASL